MRARASSVGTAILLLSFLLCSYRDGKSADATVKGNAQSQSQSLPRPRQGVYSSDPDHIWNRLFRLFYVRHARDGQQYGGDELDPYLWWQTKYRQRFALSSAKTVGLILTIKCQKSPRNGDS